MEVIHLLRSAVERALTHLGTSYQGTIFFDHPRETSFGDISTNIAMVLAQQEGVSPKDLATRIVEFLNENKGEEVLKVEVAGPGFINFFLSPTFFNSSVQQVVKEADRFGAHTFNENKKVLIEHSSPNLFKPFHIGHLMNNTVGESLVRLVKYSGAETTVISYPSDVSLGIGKAVWQLLEYGTEHLHSLPTLEEKVSFLGQCYAQGTQAYDERPEIQSRVKAITQDLYFHNDTEAYQAYLLGKELNLEYFRLMTDRLGSHFDGYIFESEAGVLGKEMVLTHVPDIYTESEGAVIYEGESEGLHTRVFINKEGNPTYEAKDTGLLALKFQRYQPDLSIFVTDDQQGPYFEVVISAAGKINPTWKENTIHATHGRMQFKGQKMSSRLGNTPLAQEILEVVNEEVHAIAKKKLTEEEAEQISLAALKYTILRTQAGKSINFDPDTSLSFEGDSGPYLQYTYARSQSLLRKAKEYNLEVNTMLPEEWEPTELERYLYRFPLVTEQAIRNLHPHLVVTYLTELAQLFNSWYAGTKILDATDLTANYKLALVSATAQTIKNGLWLLGIEAPEEM